MSFIAASFTEETLKYLPIAYARYRNGHTKQKLEGSYVDRAIAGALAFGVAGILAFLYAATNSPSDSWSSLGVLFLE